MKGDTWMTQEMWLFEMEENINTYGCDLEVNFLKLSAGFMMTSSNGIFSALLALVRWIRGESTGHRWVPLHRGQWHGALVFSLICAWTNGWAKNRIKAGYINWRTQTSCINMPLRYMDKIGSRNVLFGTKRLFELKNDSFIHYWLTLNVWGSS